MLPAAPSSHASVPSIGRHTKASIIDGHARIKRFRAGIHHRKWFGDARVFAKGTNPKQLVTARAIHLRGLVKALVFFTTANVLVNHLHVAVQTFGALTATPRTHLIVDADASSDENRFGVVALVQNLQIRFVNLNGGGPEMNNKVLVLVLGLKKPCLLQPQRARLRGAVQTR